MASAVTSFREWSKQRGLWQDAAYRFSRNKLAVFGLVCSVLLILMTIFAPLISPYPYEKQDYTVVGEGPSMAHPMGVDPIGRDMLSRIIYGGRISISVGVLVQIAALLLGVPLGALAGFFGGKVDYVVMRLVDAFMAFPSLLLAILVMVTLGPGYSNVLLAMAVVAWPPICRLVRGQFLTLRENEFVMAARSLGVPEKRIILKHIMPNSLAPVIVAITLGIPAAIFREAGLSFLGIGILPPTPSWGQMVGEYYLMIQTYWHLPVFPALVLGFTILAFTFVGDGLQDALSPRDMS